MRETTNKSETDAASNAASLMKINVRKSKGEGATVAPTNKSGDITERLAILARELDSALEQPYPQRDLPLPSAPTNTYPNKWDSSQPDRRNNSAKETSSSGWRQRNAPPDILSYWLDIRGDQRRYPSWQTLEPEVIGKHWPNCMLVHCNREIGRLQVKFGFTHAVRKAALEGTPDEELLNRIEFTPMIVDWVLGMAREVATSRKPAHATEYFPTITGEVPLRVIGLPLSENARDIDHVLCYIQKLQ